METLIKSRFPRAPCVPCGLCFLPTLNQSFHRRSGPRPSDRNWSSYPRSSFPTSCPRDVYNPTFQRSSPGSNANLHFDSERSIHETRRPRSAVTGASKASATLRPALAREGATIAAAARNREKLDELVAAIAAAGGQAAAFVIDVADEDQIKSGVKQALAQFGKIDILVNNAGITRDQLVMRMKRRLGRRPLHQPDLRYLCIQQVIGSMLKQRWDASSTSQHLRPDRTAGQANYAPPKPDSSASPWPWPAKSQPQHHRQRVAPDSSRPA